MDVFLGLVSALRLPAFLHTCVADDTVNGGSGVAGCTIGVADAGRHDGCNEVDDGDVEEVARFTAHSVAFKDDDEVEDNDAKSTAVIASGHCFCLVLTLDF